MNTIQMTLPTHCPTKRILRLTQALFGFFSKRSICFLLFATWGICGCNTQLWAQIVKTYFSEVSLNIEENDIDFAKNRAFQTAQQQILASAVQDLIEPDLYQEYQRQILWKSSLTPQKYLVSAKILEESSAAGVFTIKVEGRIQLQGLKEHLAKLHLVFKDDPFLPITVLIEESIPIDRQALTNRFRVFHLTLNRLETIQRIGISAEERNTKAFVQELFNRYPQNRVLFLIEAIPENEDSLISEIRTRIFRQSDLEQINTFSLRLSQPVAKDAIDSLPAGDQLTERFLSLLTLQSLKKEDYGKGIKSTFLVTVKGLTTPYSRWMFEQTIFRHHHSIRAFNPIRLSSESCVYWVQTNSSLESVIDIFRQPNPHFVLTIDSAEFNQLQLSVHPSLTTEYRPPAGWYPEEAVLKRIQEALLNPLENANGRAATIELEPEFVPRFQETEPNNNSVVLNDLPPHLFLLGKISSRADEDIFRLPLSAAALVSPKSALTRVDLSRPLTRENLKSATVHIEWIRLGKTTLSPQIRLYRHDFTFVNVYSLIGNQNRLLIEHRFDQDIPPTVFIRISDKIGFIPGETGGFKFFEYVIRYHWTTEPVRPDL